MSPDLDAAREALRDALAEGDPEAAAWAGIRAGDLLVQAGEIEEGRAAYEAVLEHGSEALRPLAMTGLGSLHRARKDWPAARAAYKAAIESGDPDAAPMAALNLGGLETFYGELSDAKAAYQMVIDSRHPELAPYAAKALADLLSAEDDDDALPLYRLALDSDDPHVAPEAGLGLGRIMRGRGDSAAAGVAYQAVIETGRLPAAATALVELGLLRLAAADPAQAKDYFDKASAQHAGNPSRRAELALRRMARLETDPAPSGSEPMSRLENALTRGSAVVLTGAGISMDPPAGLPDWIQLRDLTVRSIAARHSPLEPFAHQLAEIPMIALPGQKGLSPEMVASVVSEECGGYFESFRVLEDGAPNLNHRWLAAAARAGAVTYILTFNFDLFLERALDEAEVPYRTYRTDAEFAGFRAVEDAFVHVLKLHGCLSAPHSITATVEQEAVGLSEVRKAALEAVLSGRWLAVWGYSGADLKIDKDHLRLISAQARCPGFFWSLFARGTFTESPSPHLGPIRKAYGLRGEFGQNLLPSALRAVADKPPHRPADSMDESAWQELREQKTERLKELLERWASYFVHPFTAGMIIGGLLQFAGFPTEATTCFTMSRQIAEEHSEPGAAARAIASLAAIASDSAGLDRAEKLYDRVAEIARAENDPVLLSTALRGHSEIARRRGDAVQALRLNAMIASIRREREPDLQPNRRNWTEALLARDRGGIEESERIWTEAVAAARTSGRLQSLGAALRGQASMHMKFGEAAEAVALLDEAERAERAIGNRSGLAETLASAAQAQVMSGRLDRAEQFLDKADEVLEGLDDTRTSAFVAGVRLMSLMWRAQSDPAANARLLTVSQENVERLRLVGEPRSLGQALMNHAAVVSETESVNASRPFLVEALQLLWPAGDRLSTAFVLRELAHRSVEAEEYDRAFNYLLWTITLFRKLEQHTVAAELLEEVRTVNSNLSGEPPWTVESALGAALGSLDSAKISALSQQLGIEGAPGDVEAIHRKFRDDSDGRFVVRVSVALKILAMHAKARREYLAARLWTIIGLRLANVIRDDYSAGILINDLGAISSAMGDPASAADRYRDAAKIAANIRDEDEYVLRQTNLASVLIKLDDRRGAIAAAREAARVALEVAGRPRLNTILRAAEMLLFLEQADAVALFGEATLEAEGQSDAEGLAHAQAGLGRALEVNDQQADAGHAWLEAAKLYQSTGHQHAAYQCAYRAGHCFVKVPELEERGHQILASMHQPAESATSGELGALIARRLAGPVGGITGAGSEGEGPSTDI